jgi:integrase
VRILLALATGLRRGDIDSLNINDIDFEKNCSATMSRKTRKSVGSRLVPIDVMAELSRYVCGLDDGQEIS